MAALLLLSVLAFALPGAQASSVGYPPLNTTITGPSTLPTNGTGNYYAVASGGPAETLEGSYVGNYTFTNEIVGVDTTGSFVTPSSGAFIGRDANFSIGGLVNDGTYTFELNVTSHGAGSKPTNLTQIFTFQITVVVPYLISATVQNMNSYTVSGAVIDVLLDGTFVGATTIPSLAASGTSVITYNYTNTTLSPGYHTFTLEIKGPPGLLEFTNGQSMFSETFYVQGAPPNYTYYWFGGASLAVLAVLISLIIFGPRRPRRKKSP